MFVPHITAIEPVCLSPRNCLQLSLQQIESIKLYFRDEYNGVRDSQDAPRRANLPTSNITILLAFSFLSTTNSSNMASSSPLTPTTFHLFSNLPQELRNEIWTLTLPAPRLIHVQTEKGEVQISGRHPNRPFSHVWAKKLAVPVVLHVCHDARTVGLKHYELVFDTNCRPAKEDLPDLHDLSITRKGRQLTFPFERRAMMYVDLDRDYIFTSCRRLAYKTDEMKDPRFAAWPVDHGLFRMEILRDVIREDVYSRIRFLAIRFTHSPGEGLRRRRVRAAGTRRQILVIKDPFVKDADGRFLLDTFPRHGFYTNAEIHWRVRLFVNVEQLQDVIDEGTAWDRAADDESEEQTRREDNLRRSFVTWCISDA